MSRRRRYLALLASVVLLISAVPPETGPDTRAEPDAEGEATTDAAADEDAPLEARARAWVVKVVVPGQEILEAGVVSARSGTEPNATAVPGAVGGQSPMRADATPEDPEDVQLPLTWEDDMGSMRVDGPYAEGRVTPGTASARAGLGAFGVSGFAIADELMTWEQQELLLGTWAELNTALFARMNEAFGVLSPLLDPLGLRVPDLEPIAATGFVDVARGRGLGADANTVVSDTFTSADASADLASFRLLGGFIVVAGISATAAVESSAGVTTPQATAAVERIRIAGIEVAVREDGLVVAGNHEPFAELLQPVLDAALDLLEQQAGLVIRVNHVLQEGELAQATALSVEYPTDAGQAAISLGYAEAEASQVPATVPELPDPPEPAESEPAPEPRPEPPTGPSGDDGPPAADGLATASDLPAAPPAGDDLAVSDPPAIADGDATNEPIVMAATPPLRLPPLPIGVAHALQSAFLLLFLAGGLIGGLLLPALVRAPQTGARRQLPRSPFDGGR